MDILLCFHLRFLGGVFIQIAYCLFIAGGFSHVRACTSLPLLLHLASLVRAPPLFVSLPACMRPPQVGFNLRKVTKGNVSIKLWDLGGQPRFRSMWERYCRGVSAIV